MRIHTPLPLFLLSLALGCSDRLVVDESNNGVTGQSDDEPEAPANAGGRDAGPEGSDDDESEPAPSEDDDDAQDPDSRDDDDDDDVAPEPESDDDDDVAPEPKSDDDDDLAPEPDDHPVHRDDAGAGTSEEPAEPLPMTPLDAGAPGEELLECPFDENLTYDPDLAYPFCQWETYVPPFIDTDPDREPTAFERFCKPLPGGWGYYNWHAAGENSGLCNNDGSCNACNCAVACNHDSPSGCPSGETGNATPACMNPDSSISGSGDCWLTCDAGEQCPDGMQCVPMPEFGRDVCAWLTEGDRCSDEQLSSP